VLTASNKKEAVGNTKGPQKYFAVTNTKNQSSFHKLFVCWRKSH